MTFTSTRQSDEQHITITVRLVGDMLVGDIHYIQFFNIIMRKCYEFMQLRLVGRNYFDPESRVSITPGGITILFNTARNNQCLQYNRLNADYLAGISIGIMARICDIYSSTRTRYINVRRNNKQSYAVRYFGGYPEFLLSRK